MATDVSTTLAEVVIVSTLRMTSSDVVEIPVTFTASNPFQEYMYLQLDNQSKGSQLSVQDSRSINHVNLFSGNG